MYICLYILQIILESNIKTRLFIYFLRILEIITIFARILQGYKNQLWSGSLRSSAIQKLIQFQPLTQNF